MIGWYHSGPKLRASDLEINELFKRFIPRPVMVIIDVRHNVVGIPTDAYFAVEEIKDVCSISSMLSRKNDVLTALSGWYGDKKDLLTRTFSNRCRGGRRDWCRTSTTRHQRFNDNDSRDARQRTASIIARTQITTVRCTKISSRRCCGETTRKPPDRLSPPRRIQSITRP